MPAPILEVTRCEQSEREEGNHVQKAPSTTVVLRGIMREVTYLAVLKEKRQSSVTAGHGRQNRLGESGSDAWCEVGPYMSARS